VGSRSVILNCIVLKFIERTVIAQSVWRWATGWTFGVVGFDSWRGLRIFLLTTPSRTSLGPTQPPIQWVPEALFLGIKWPGLEADHSPPSSAEVKECVDLYIHSPNTPSWRGAQLKHRDNLPFFFTFYRPLKMWNVYWSPYFLDCKIKIWRRCVTSIYFYVCWWYLLDVTMRNVIRC
jgi:hypothetical protein